MEIREIFENLIKIEPKVMSIESLFNNPERVENTNYKPSYQRNYVWDDEKATYFIESILLGTEIPPLIYFRNSDKVEVIDGRQRYQTILRFINNDFKLRKNGLHKLEDVGIANKSFKDIGDKLFDLFWDTKLRIIEFSFHSKNLIDDEIEELVKKEIFKRYNSGITPLKPTEIDKAAYFEDDLNTFIKEKLQGDAILYKDVSSLLHFEKSNTEIILKKIRQLLVQHQIPIKYYSVRKDTVISKYYDFLFSNITSGEIPDLYQSFIAKINLLKGIQKAFSLTKINYNRLITECLFWAFSILENEKYSLQLINPQLTSELVKYIGEHIDAFGMDRSSFSKELFNRYLITSEFFEKYFKINFQLYLQYSAEFKQKNKDIKPKNKEGTSFDELRINKPEPSSIAIMDICRQMTRQRFLIRPPYQRNEVINKKKSSSIIESILLGIKLPPIFVFKRDDDISEVLDGQQRLLSILGFIQEPYLDETNKLRPSDKDGYSLNLKNSILKNLNGKTYQQLSPEQKSKIKNFDLWIIEINQKNNSNFEPIDLFIRLNNKPYPIKEDTFEMWNSYISRDIISTIKSIHKNNKDWFYLRKNNSRMEDENIYTSLAYFQYSLNNIGENNYESNELDIYKVVDKINFRVKSKNDITRIMEDPESKESFITACNDFEFSFIRKVKELISDNSEASIVTLNKNLDFIFNVENGRRTQQSFYALWYFLYDIPSNIIKQEKLSIRNNLKELYTFMTSVESKMIFDAKIHAFKEKFNGNSKLTLFSNLKPNFLSFKYAKISEISNSGQGIIITNFFRSPAGASKDSYVFYKKIKLENLSVIPDDTAYSIIDDKPLIKELFDAKPKILLRKSNLKSDRFIIGYTEQKFAFSPDILCVVPTRAGLSPKYITAILSSRYIFYLLNEMKINRSEESKLFSLLELKDITIPIIDIKLQTPFVKIVDYLQFAHNRLEIRLYFERLLDTMVYELFISAELKDSGSDVLKYLYDLPSLIGDREKDMQVLSDLYDGLSSPTNPISTALLKILNVGTISLIEGAF